ncbi:BREX-1 system adenine-specific DNA-methyltransferase PglX [Subdoligranulum sp. DSM 109015]|uniref:site-specific DNA-methyltransferase (adenine-specific) n=1 Tax=Gemmiger gallinarum TaxID=2779354 RepID=A0ABR9R6B2_9FIRM|nr:BREX-1 system adenine-specific DNA-methyltransferase PglX [Gemmiger gallinarum]MBE5038677.1 BREX-1 system adenine-specific DNA-methyltransferase PglX [Gemmiger gallinarum]
MDKNAIKKFAVWARRELISRVSQRAAYFEITEAGFGDPAADSVLGRVLSAEEKTQRQALIAQIRQKGYQQVMEEVAYTWFNRFIALRFMEVNGYLPSHVRVFTDEDNQFKPQILAEAIHMELDGLDMQKVYAFKNANNDDGLFKYMVIVQCNALSSILPGMFQQISDYTELLFPDNLLREGSVLQQMIQLIPEEDWKDAVQIIGWMYQYYITELNELVYDGSMSKARITKELLPAATTIYTPDWAVRYMVENSLGRLWVEGHPNDELKATWKYYLEEAEQEPDVQAQLAELRKEYAAMPPEQIKCIDPCCGSGHILAYLFDVLVQIYESYGYTTREAVTSIVQNNLYGLDIDDRAAQLAYFAVMMKARQYDRRFFSRGMQPHVYAIQNSGPLSHEAWGLLGEEEEIAHRLWDSFADAKEYGSLVKPNATLEELERLKKRVTEVDRMSSYGNLFTDAMSYEILRTFEPLIELTQALVQKYDVVVTNPPYLGSSRFSPLLDKFVKENYPDVKNDLSMVMYKHALVDLAKPIGYTAFITTSSWMFLSGFEKLRKFVDSTAAITSLVDFGTELFDGKVGHNPIVSWVTYSANLDYKMSAVRLVEYCYARRDEKEPEFFNQKNCYTARQSNFSKIPGSPVTYWVNEKIIGLLENKKFYDEFSFKRGLTTADNNRFLRLWFEVNLADESLSIYTPSKRWFSYNKGGEYRKWYGNREYVVDWENDGERLKNYSGSAMRNLAFAFSKVISYSSLTSGKLSFRMCDNCLNDQAGNYFVPTATTTLTYALALLNSCVSEFFIKIKSQTLNTTADDFSALPICVDSESTIENFSNDNMALAKADWDSFETSWDFKQHPLVRLRLAGAYAWGSKLPVTLLSSAYRSWKLECDGRFQKLKANEEELNRIFIAIYGLQDELTPEVTDKDVTVHYLVDTKDDIPASLRGSNYVLTRRDVIVSLISYAVGCMLGRYSLDVEGLAYAGGDWDSVYRMQQEIYTVEGKEVHLADGRVLTVKPTGYNQIKTDDGWKTLSYPVDADNVIPICDDEYFDDDMVGRFVKFIETVYGSDTLEENLKFIADALGGKGTPRDVIRSYFLNDFYADHCKTYQKRPIYWLFDSGKKNGFKALIYMHRYQPDTIARIRTDYVHEQQSRYRTAIADLESRIAAASTAERVKLNKQLKKLQEQDAELRTYEEKIHHLADQMISIDLDDGVKVNYAKFQDVLAKIK